MLNIKVARSLKSYLFIGEHKKGNVYILKKVGLSIFKEILI